METDKQTNRQIKRDRQSEGGDAGEEEEGEKGKTKERKLGNDGNECIEYREKEKCHRRKNGKMVVK